MIFEMPNLWDIFVVQVFGSFWLTVGIFAIIFFGLMMLVGDIGMLSALYFVSFFFFAMAIGYSNPLISVFLFLFVLLYFVTSLIKYLNNQAYG